MNTKRGRLYGVIHIGSVALSLCIAEYVDSRQVTVVQEARRAADFGVRKCLRRGRCHLPRFSECVGI